MEPRPAPHPAKEPRPTPRESLGPWDQRLDRAIGQAEAPGKRVLQTARAMMADNVLVVGSCWDFADAVFGRAGFVGKGRQTVFRGSRERKRFAKVGRIRPGDWLYYVNHQYRGVPHSAIFVGWLDRPRKWAVMITYRGARRRLPGVLDAYDLSSVYRIVRAAP